MAVNRKAVVEVNRKAAVEAERKPEGVAERSEEEGAQHKQEPREPGSKPSIVRIRGLCGLSSTCTARSRCRSGVARYSRKLVRYRFPPARLPGVRRPLQPPRLGCRQ